MSILKCPCGVDLVETYNPNSDHHQGWLCWYVDKCSDDVERSWFIFVMCDTCNKLNALSLKHDRRLIRKPLEYFAGRIRESGPQTILCTVGCRARWKSAKTLNVYCRAWHLRNGRRAKRPRRTLSRRIVAVSCAEVSQTKFTVVHSCRRRSLARAALKNDHSMLPSNRRRHVFRDPLTQKCR